MLTPLDESPWHQLPTTFDHAGTSDPRFFDRHWLVASDGRGGGVVQFTLGIYQNMNVVDGGVVVTTGGRQHNLRVSRELRPRYDTACGPLRLDLTRPMELLTASIGPNPSGVAGELEWSAELGPQEERHHFRRRQGRVLEDYSRYDQIGRCSGWVEAAGVRIDVDRWWSCRDHSWGVRQGIGMAEPVTAERPRATGDAARGGSEAMFAFLFYSTPSSGGHVQLTLSSSGSAHVTAALVDRATGTPFTGRRVTVEAEFIDDDRPRRFRRAWLEVADQHGEVRQFELEAQGPYVAMTGLGYGGYADGLGLGVWRGAEHLEHDVFDVSDPAAVGLPGGRLERPVHCIQPVAVAVRGPEGTSTGTGSFTLVAERWVDGDGRLRAEGWSV